MLCTPLPSLRGVTGSTGARRADARSLSGPGRAVLDRCGVHMRHSPRPTTRVSRRSRRCCRSTCRSPRGHSTGTFQGECTRGSPVGGSCAGGLHVVQGGVTIARAPIGEAEAEIGVVVNSSEPSRVGCVSGEPAVAKIAEELDALVVRVELVRARDAMVDKMLQRLGREGLRHV
eukprot:7351617-Prymnesium_polylepis.2